MRTVFILFCVCYLWSCRSTAPVPNVVADTRPLPDLIIKKVTYRAPTSSPKFNRPRGGVLEATYEFEFLVENIGNTPFSQQFVINYTKTQSEFQNSIYSQQHFFNESRAVILPGKSLSFKMDAEVEITQNTFGFSTLPMRFMLNHEWGSFSLHPSSGPDLELSYENNTYELSMRLQLRR
ncbi:MAG TPA: hypothetical protein VGB10_00915 [Bacteroidota bacterium]